MIDKRVFITVIVCVAVMLVWHTYVAPPKKPSPASQPAKIAAPAQAPASPASMAAAAASEPTAPVDEKKQALTTAKVALTLSSHGAALTQATLNDYKEGGTKRGEQKHPVNLLPPSLRDRVDGVSVLVSGEPLALVAVEKTDRSVVFSGVHKGLDARATWAFTAHDYVLDLTVELKNSGAAEVAITPAVRVAGVFNEQTAKDKSMFTPAPDQNMPAAYVDGKLIKHAHDEKDSPPANPAVAWIGIDKQYFLIAAAPVDTPVTGATFEEQRLPNEPTLTRMTATLPAKETKLAPGQSTTARYQVFVGPKVSGFLKAPGRQFEEAVDYKVWFMPLGFLSRPMLWILNQAHAVFGSYGIAILILTFLVKLLLLPVTQKSFVSMQVMRDLKPELDKIKTRFPDDREKQGLATMQLYKEKNVNPFLSGCLPALLQMPVYLALWRTLWAAVELYQQEFLWLGDLTAKDPYFILPLLLGVTMFAQQKLSPPMGDPQQQKIMLYMMPPMMTMFMVGLSSGLVFYIFVNTILTILQQAYITRKFGKKPVMRPAT